MGPNEFNPSGYWENQQVVRLNERVLSHLGTSWSDVFMLPYRLDRTNLCEIFEAEAKALLQEDVLWQKTVGLKGSTFIDADRLLVTLS